jgi:hypothetical protein
MPDEKLAEQFSEDFPTPEEPKDPLMPDVPKEEPKAEDQEDRKNRRERRLESRLQAERESSIHLAARLEALTEAQKFANETKGLTIDDRLLTLYGDNENGRKAAQITQSLLEDTRKQARQEAFEDLQKAQAEQQAEQKDEEKFIDDQLDNIEDEYGVDLTSNSPQGRKNRSDFLTMVSKFSPKDEQGNIKEYADFGEVYDTFKDTRKADTSRQKDLASRSMAKSGSSASPTRDVATEKYLQSLGII